MMSDPIFRVQQIDHVELYVPERYAAARWYAGVFGLSIVPGFEHWAAEGGPLMVSSDGGSTKLALFTGDPLAAPCKRIAFRVSGPDYLTFLERLETQPLTHDSGAPLTRAHTVDHDQSWSIYFVDPWGNRFEITTYDYAYIAEHFNH
jgi:catechol 2,3-dioxygenase-like lactoylglutathione lyase family enzyme